MTNHESLPPEGPNPDTPEPEYDAAGTPIVRFCGVPWRAGKTDAQGRLVITQEQWDAAVTDPEVIKLVEKARKEADRWEEVEPGFLRLKPEYRDDGI